MSQGLTGTASAGYARALLDYVRTIGIDPGEICSAEVLGRICDREASNRIDLAEFEALFDRAIVLAQDPELPLRMAESIMPRHLGLVGYVIQTCASLGEAMSALQQYEKLVDDANETRATMSDNKLELHWIPRATTGRSDIFMKLSLATWATFARRLTGKPDLMGEAYFSCAKPSDPEIYTRVFGCPARFEQPTTRLVCASSYLRLPVTHSDPEMHEQFSAQAEELLKKDGEADLVHELKLVVSRRLATGRVTLEQIAESMNVSQRTLQYRLDEHGVTFRELLDDVRRALAEGHLRMTRISIAEIAFLLGYAEQSSFQHAFKRWTGKTPGEFRTDVSSPSPRAALGPSYGLGSPD